MSGDSPSPPRYFIQALARGLAMLEVFDDQHPELTLSELARALGTNKPTARRFVQTLVDLGYLEPRPGKRYRLGVRSLDLGRRYLAGLDLPTVVRPFLHELAQATGESCNLAIRDGADVVYLVRVQAAPRILSVNLQVGSRLPVHATSLGKALVADASALDLVGMLGTPPWPAYTAQTRRDPEALAPDLAHVQAYGFALADGELEPGLRSIAAPVRGAAGQVVAAVNVSTHTARVPLEHLLGPMGDHLRSAARQISALLGDARTVGRRSAEAADAHRL